MIHLLKCGLAAAAALLITSVTLTVQAQVRHKVVVGENAAIALFWPDFIAARKGFYAREGLDTQTVFSGGSAPSVQQLIGGSLDVVFVSCAVPIFAINKGAEIAIIGETLGKWPYTMMAANDIKSAADLKGRKVILATSKDPTTIFWRRWLTAKGVRPTDVDEVFDGATPNRYAALVNKAVSAALLTQPLDFRARIDGYAPLVDFAADDKDYAFVCIAARRQWLKENPDRARALMRAVAAAIDWWYDSRNKDEAIRILMDATRVEEALARQTYDYFAKVQPWSRQAKVSQQGMRNLVDLLITTGDLPAETKAEKFVDAAYATE